MFRFHSISIMRSLGSETQHKATLLIKNAESDLRWLRNVEWIMNWFHRFFLSLSCTTRYGIHGSSSSTAWHSLFFIKNCLFDWYQDIKYGWVSDFLVYIHSSSFFYSIVEKYFLSFLFFLHLTVHDFKDRYHMVFSLRFKR